MRKHSIGEASVKNYVSEVSGWSQVLAVTRALTRRNSPELSYSSASAISRMSPEDYGCICFLVMSSYGALPNVPLWRHALPRYISPEEVERVVAQRPKFATER